MRYIGEFADINGHDYTVTITTSTGAGSKKITLGGAPFVTAQSAGDTMYEPLKCSTGSVEVLTGDYMLDVYSPTAQGTKVEVSDASGVVWTGYVTPCLYDMGFVEEREKITIECVDALATLQNIKYSCDVRRVRSLSSIVRDIISRCNAYTAIFVSANTRLPGKSTPILDDLYISDENFFKNVMPTRRMRMWHGRARRSWRRFAGTSE